VTEERRTGWEEADRWFSDEARGAGGGRGGGDGDAGGEEPEGPPPAPRCESCGAELEPDQTYCLECGSPTPLAPKLRRGRKALALLAGAMIVLGAGAGALAYAVASDDEDGGAPSSSVPAAVTAPTGGATVAPPPATGPLPTDTSFTASTAPTAPTAPTDTAGTVTGFPTVTGPTTTAPATTDETVPTETEPETTPGAGTGSSDWPAGETAWTAVLSSVRSESDARAAKSRVAASGEPAGVLFSSDFPGLRPGYWVVFSGTFPGRAAAESQANALRSDFPDAYARRIEG
jgi:SPOR domain